MLFFSFPPSPLQHSHQKATYATFIRARSMKTPTTSSMSPVCGLLMIVASTVTAATPPQLPHQLQSLPGPVFDPIDFGAVGDGVHNDTAGVQAAVDAAASSIDGGLVFLRPGRTFRSGSLLLRSHVTLHVAAGSTLLGSPVHTDYPLRWRGKFVGGVGWGGIANALWSCTRCCPHTTNPERPIGWLLVPTHRRRVYVPYV